jgi:NADH-ubiquinone/plastoquinone oxidoreductase subunit 3
MGAQTLDELLLYQSRHPAVEPQHSLGLPQIYFSLSAPPTDRHQVRPMPDNYFARYLPVLIHFLLAGALASVMVLLSWIIGYRKPSRAKSSPYACGMTPVGDARERFSVKSYMLRRKNGRAQYPGRKSCYCVTTASYSVRREPLSTARNDWDA